MTNMIEQCLISQVKAGVQKLPSHRMLTTKYGIGRTKAINTLKRVQDAYPGVVVVKKSDGHYVKELESVHPAIAQLLDAGFTPLQIQELAAAEMTRRSHKTVTVVGDPATVELIKAELGDIIPLSPGGIIVSSDYNRTDIDVRLKLTNHIPLVGKIYAAFHTANIGIVSNSSDFSEQVLGALGYYYPRQISVMIASASNRRDCNLMFDKCDAIITDRLSIGALNKLACYYKTGCGKSAPKFYCVPHVSTESIKELREVVKK